MVPIPAALVADLAAHRAEFGIGAATGPYSPTGTAKRGTRPGLGEVWRTARAALAAQGTPLPASARGSIASAAGTRTRLLTAGVPLAEVSAVLGPRDPSTTIRTYAHVVDTTAAHARVRSVFD